MSNITEDRKKILAKFVYNNFENHYHSKKSLDLFWLQDLESEYSNKMNDCLKDSDLSYMRSLIDEIHQKFNVKKYSLVDLKPLVILYFDKVKDFNVSSFDDDKIRNYLFKEDISEECQILEYLNINHHQLKHLYQKGSFFK